MAGQLGPLDLLRDREGLRGCWHAFANAPMAEQLDVSSATVNSHLSHCRSQLGGRNRLQVVPQALCSGQLKLQLDRDPWPMQPSTMSALAGGSRRTSAGPA